MKYEYRPWMGEDAYECALEAEGMPYEDEIEEE